MVLPRVVAVLVLLSSVIGQSGCRSESQSAVAPAEQIWLEAGGTQFDRSFEARLSELEVRAAADPAGPASWSSRLYRDLMLLELFLSAWLSEEEELYGRFQQLAGLKLQGPLSEALNFQLCAQALLERFRTTARGAREQSEVAARATALAAYAGGLQGILFRNKRDYFAGREAVSAFPELAWLAHLMTARDLVVETLERTGRPQQNWQNIVLTVFAPDCARTVGRFIDLVCTADRIEGTEEFCHSDFDLIPASRRERGRGFLAAYCREAEGAKGEPVGEALLKTRFSAAFDSLAAVSRPLPQPLAQVVSRWREREAEAWSGLAFLFE